MLPASNATLAAVLLLVAACGACDGFAQGALFGEAALLPPRFTQALVTGTAVSGARGALHVLTVCRWAATAAHGRGWWCAAQLLPSFKALPEGRRTLLARLVFLVSYCACLHPPPSSGVAISLLRVVTKAMLPGTEAGLRASANM